MNRGLNNARAMLQGPTDWATIYKNRNEARSFPRQELMPSDVLRLARLEGARSIETLAEIRDDPAAPAQVRVNAANGLLDRAYGKPVQGIVVQELPPPAEYDLSSFSTEELLQLETLLQKAGTSLGGPQAGEVIDLTAGPATVPD